jgi:hypothetical protein
MDFTLYIDEVGHESFKGIDGPNERYLSLTGVIIERQVIRDYLYPQMDELKYKYCPSHDPDDPVILHRNEIVNKNRPFEALRDARVCAAFDNDLLNLFRQTEYVILTVVIDKTAMLDKYRWPYPPYHYGLEILVERYVWLLEALEATGNIMAEKRTTKADRSLSDAFTTLRNNGTKYVNQARIKRRLTSDKLKLKTKWHNIAGLQLADLLANPSFKRILAHKNGQRVSSTFGDQIADILERSKYYRKRNGRIEGYGTKWLP